MLTGLFHRLPLILVLRKDFMFIIATINFMSKVLQKEKFMFSNLLTTVELLIIADSPLLTKKSWFQNLSDL